MKIVETNIPEVKIIELKVFGDQRGFFMETYHRNRYIEQAASQMNLFRIIILVPSRARCEACIIKF